MVGYRRRSGGHGPGAARAPAEAEAQVGSGGDLTATLSPTEPRPSGHEDVALRSHGGHSRAQHAARSGSGTLSAAGTGAARSDPRGSAP
jgi:hypothetical protein